MNLFQLVFLDVILLTFPIFISAPPVILFISVISTVVSILNIVFNSFGNSNIPCKFICADASYKSKYSNIDVKSNVSNKEYFDLLVNSYCVIVAIDNSNLAGGEITIINAMQFGKPVILIQDNLTNDYVFDGITGFIVEKDRNKICEIAKNLLKNRTIYIQMATNARRYYEEHFTIFSVGEEIGKLI